MNFAVRCGGVVCRCTCCGLESVSGRFCVDKGTPSTGKKLVLGLSDMSEDVLGGYTLSSSLGLFVRVPGAKPDDVTCPSL